MQVKVFEAITTGGLERQVNKFIGREGIKVIDMKFGSSLFGNTVLIMYEEVQIEFSYVREV